MVGDFNVRVRDLLGDSADTADPSPSAASLLEAWQRARLVPVQNQLGLSFPPTSFGTKRTGAAVVDYILSTPDVTPLTFTTDTSLTLPQPHHDSPPFDHALLITTLSVPSTTSVQHITHTSPTAAHHPLPTSLHTTYSADWEAYQDCLKSELKNTPPLPATAGIEERMSRIMNIIATIGQETGVVRKQRHERHKDKHTRWLQGQRTAARKALRRNPNDPALQQQCKLATKAACNEARQLRRQQRRSKTQDLHHTLGHNPYLAWKKLKQALGDVVQPPAPQWVPHTDSLVTYFQSLFRKPEAKDLNELFIADRARWVVENEEKRMSQASPSSTTSDDSINRPFTSAEVLRAMQRLHTRRSTGMDGIPAELLHYAQSEELGKELADIYTLMLNTGVIPPTWGKALSTPIGKKTAVTTPGDGSQYRLLSMLGAPEKLLTTMMQQRLIDRFDPTLEDEQNGFRPARGVQDNILSLWLTQEATKQAQVPLYLAFLDITKAFDSLDYDILWMLLIRDYKVTGPFLRLLRCLYSNSTTQLRLPHNECSDPIDIERGIRQGDPLSPLLFIMFIAGLPQFLRQQGHVGCTPLPGGPTLRCLLYADDIVLAATSPEDLQHALNLAHTFLASRRLYINPGKGKSELLLIRPHNSTAVCPSMWCGHHLLHPTDSYTYLGMIFSSSLSTADQRRLALEEAKKALGRVAHLLRSDSLAPRCITPVVHATLTSQLEYAAAVWDTPSVPWPEADKIYITALRNAFHLPPFSSRMALLAETGTHPWHIRSAEGRIALLQRLMGGGRVDSITAQLIVSSLNSPLSLTAGTWANETHLLLDSLGITIAGIDHAAGHLRQRWQEEYDQTCVDDQRLATWYHTIQQHPTRAHYLSRGAKYDRAWRTRGKFRMGLEHFPFPTSGGQVHPAVVCPLCHAHEHSPTHTLCYCPALEEHRKACKERLVQELPDSPYWALLSTGSIDPATLEDGARQHRAEEMGSPLWQDILMDTDYVKQLLPRSTKGECFRDKMRLVSGTLLFCIEQELRGVAQGGDEDTADAPAGIDA